MIGFRRPVELLGQSTGNPGAPGSPVTERTAKSGRQEDKPEAGPDEEGSGESQEEADKEENSADEDQGEAEEKQEEPEPPRDPTMWMYIPRLGIRGHTVREGDSEQLMALGAMKLPSTAHPWQGGANPYITGHRIGYPGRESYYQFYNLPAMRTGNPVYLRDANWSLYEYRVTEKFAVGPSESWVTEPVTGKDLVTLQTCTDSVARSTWWDITPKLMAAGPDTGRLIIRAERV
ncbi:class E sortase [Rubrobacter aplysinae]|uniref:class E sortase n=1 Tax=Rubrobacter aplysinae TaxID=909625 RepID=UPI00128E8201|nr:class E sortase [Rubrobacter aplysinae]